MAPRPARSGLCAVAGRVPRRWAGWSEGVKYEFSGASRLPAKQAAGGPDDTWTFRGQGVVSLRESEQALAAQGLERCSR